VNTAMFYTYGDYLVDYKYVPISGYSAMHGIDM
jgi:hypothetical protein